MRGNVVRSLSSLLCGKFTAAATAFLLAVAGIGLSVALWPAPAQAAAPGIVYQLNFDDFNGPAQTLQEYSDARGLDLSGSSFWTNASRCNGLVGRVNSFSGPCASARGTSPCCPVVR